MNQSALTLRERLVETGVPVTDVKAHLFSLLYPWPQRCWWNLRLLLGGDPFTAEHELLIDLLNARTHIDADNALRDYRTCAAHFRTAFMRPRKRRLKRVIHEAFKDNGPCASAQKR